MTLQRWLFAILGLVIICSLPCVSKKPRAVTTLINARWSVTPLVFEVAEYLADEQADYLWAFIESVNNIKPKKLEEFETEKEIYHELLNQAGQFISPAKIQLLKLALSLHIYAPKIAMYKQVAEEQGITSTGCSTIALVGNITSCDPSKIASIVESLKHEPSINNSFKLNVDHHYPGSANNSIIAVLYGQVGTQQFAEFHKVLKQEALNGNVDYIVRHYIQDDSQDKPGRRIRLSGYGVELQLKSTEYKVQDDSEVKDGNVGVDEEDEEDLEGFNFQKLKQLYPDFHSQLNKFRLSLLDSSDELAPLKVWQFQALSLQAAAQIMKSPVDEALHVMTTIAQNFPQQARPLLRVKVDPEMKKEIKVNQDMFSSILSLQPQDTAIFINGMFFDLDVVDIISLLEVLREEHRTMQGLHSVGISDKQIKALMALDFSSWLSDSSDYALDIRDTSILWINNIVTDERFKRGSDSFRDLFQPIFSGHFRNIRRNLYNLVVIGDPSKKNVLDLLTGMIQLHQNPARIPVRLGVVFAVNPDSLVSGHDDAGVAVLNAFNYVTEKSGPLSALSFVVNTYAALPTPRDLEVQDVLKALKKKYSYASDKIFDVDSDFNTGRLLADDYLHRSGLRKFPQALMNGVPMEDKFLNADDFAGAVENEMHRQTPIYQKAFFRRELRDTDNEVDFIMSRPNVMPRLNTRILNVEESVQLDLSAIPPSTFSAAELSETSSPNISALLVNHIAYVTPPERPNKKSVHFITNWVLADLAAKNKKGREVLQAALKHMESSGNVRVGFIPNIRDSQGSNLNHIVVAAFKSQPNRVLKALLKKILDDGELVKESISDEDLEELNIPDLDVTVLRATLESEEFKSLLAVFSEFARRVVSVPLGQRAVISNGRILGPLDADEDFTEEDFSLLERHSTATHIEKIKEAVDEVTSEGDADISSDTAMKVINILLAKPQSRNRFQIPAHSTEHSVLTLKPQRDTEPAFFIDVIVDPVSRGAQKASSILLLLRNVLNCYIRVFLNPVDKNSDMPVKSFYRFVAEPELQFSPDGSLSAGPIARFTNLPTTSLLTQNLQVPENWLVESVRSPYDLDNIRLDGVVGTVHSEYELEHLLLEGHCFEVITSNPPRGLQMTLGTETTPLMVDTIVMANLGYFQFKANPGAWVLRLRQGRSADLYDIVGHEGTDSTDGKDIKVVLSSFRSHVLKLRVQKKRDKINQDLLSDDDDAKSGLWSSLTNTFSGGDAEENQEPINIFSLASGHLYERFLRIMMLSVLRHTKTPVKFWFLKNYLSPTFKDFLPHMAKEFGFQYQLVQYKWPRWLHQQTEKQRTIWGYKILFLDVLFPLDVKKIIFVDADQVVRTDLKELRDFDLGGAPYGYTPFCDSRKEMDGFRFWRQGYWRSHLQGRKYHISALYVVDLKKFRRIAAGDRLRGQYQALSQDPNSLSNLDQDLPNNMIHQVQIKSLPQEWLWCETWCADESKKYAKTIDLCNNPMTKEAKLSAAMRILPEWKEYDEEIKKLQKRIVHDDLEESAEFEEGNSNDAVPPADGAKIDLERDEL